MTATEASPNPVASGSTSLNTLAIDLRLALRNLMRQRRRSLIAIAAIGFGIISMMLAAGFIEWIFWANRDGVTVKQIGHIQVAKPGYYESGKADPFAYLLPADTTALAAITSHREVTGVAPRIDFIGLVSHGESTLSFVGEGIDPELDPALAQLHVIEGELLSAEEPNGFILGSGLAANLGVKTGDTVVLLASTGTGGINAVEGRVRGLVSTSMKAFDDSLLRVNIDTARTLLHVPGGAHVWITSLSATRLTERVVDKLADEASLGGYEITPWTKLADFYNKTVELLTRQIQVVKVIIGVIIILSIGNTMTMSVLERTTEIGTAMALGLRARRILRMFIVDALQQNR